MLFKCTKDIGFGFECTEIIGLMFGNIKARKLGPSI